MITVRPVSPSDHEALAGPVRRLRRFLPVAVQTAEMRQVVWLLLNHPADEVNGLIAVDEKSDAVGLATRSAIRASALGFGGVDSWTIFSSRRRPAAMTSASC